jgi:segregation and condensation protein A
MESSTTNYKIDVPAFSGPLDLLLHLIERNELDITAISLTAVTEQYLAQIEQLKADRMELLVDFLIIGARLLVIKSRALLPQLPPSLLDAEEEDPAEALARQLRTYKLFKESAVWLNHRYDARLRTYLRVVSVPNLESSLDLTGISVDTLITALHDALDRAQLLEDSISVATERRKLTIEDQIERLRTLLSSSRRVQFNELLSGPVSRVELSVTLLAVLELIKRHEVNARQVEVFGPIELIASE